MTGFDSLSGDILSAAADKLAARDAKKGQLPGAKTGDKASKAFGTHLNRLAQEHEFKSATSKAGDVRPETPRAETRAFALPSGAFDDRALTAASAKILATTRIAEDTKKLADETKVDAAVADSSIQDVAAPIPNATETRPHVVIHHAAMGFSHEIPIVADEKSSPAQSDIKGRAEVSEVKPSAKSDDPRLSAMPQMPSAAVDVPAFSAQTFTESPDVSVQHAAIRAPMPTKVAVVSQETHFEPVLPSATLQQIANAIGEEMPVGLDATAAAVSIVAMPNETDRAGPVKTLTLQLDPASLGSVTVKMKLTGAAIEVQIAASRAETAQLLEHDRGALSRLLQASGYETDVATVQIQSVAASSNSDAGQSASNFQGQSGQSSAQGQFDPSNQRANDQRPGAQHNQQERRQFPLPQEERHGHDPAARSGTIQSGSLYL